MNALEDTRPLESLHRTLGSASPTVRSLERAHEFGALISDLIRGYPDIDLPTIRLSETGDQVTVTGRRGPLIADPPAGHHLIASEAFTVPDEDPNEATT